MRYYNPKNVSEYVDTELELPQAIEKIKNSKEDFHTSLVFAYSRGTLSQSQKYWVMKLATRDDVVPVQLLSNLQEFVGKANKIRLYYEGFDSVTLAAKPDRVTVFVNRLYSGHIIGDKFYPTGKCPSLVRFELVLYSKDPISYMMEMGKRVGRCCVCGLTLTNPESIALGIGPICREKW